METCTSGLPSPQAFIERLPDELLSQIFTIGCEKNLSIRAASKELDFYPFLAEDPFIEDAEHGNDYDGTRRPKRFTTTVMRVCRRWFSIAIAPSNSHLWLVRAALSSVSVDFAVDFTRFHNALRNFSRSGSRYQVIFSAEDSLLSSHCPRPSAANSVPIAAARHYSQWGLKFISLLLLLLPRED